jgi:hypothetical protein
MKSRKPLWRRKPVTLSKPGLGLLTSDVSAEVGRLTKMDML